MALGYEIMTKRGFNTSEAMAYFGVKRRAFEKYIRPHLKPVRFGTSIIFDRLDLDAVFEQYRAENERPARKESKSWVVQQGGSQALSGTGKEECGPIDKVIGGERVRKRFSADLEQANRWLIDEIAHRGQKQAHTAVEARTFAEAARRYIELNQTKRGIVTDIHMLRSVMPYIGDVPLDRISNETMAGYIEDRREAGVRGKTINNGLEVVQRVLNCCVNEFRDGPEP